MIESALVSGGASGLGAAVAARLERNGLAAVGETIRLDGVLRIPPR